MKIVFIKDVPKVGRRDEVKEVADGYARFLIGSGAAVLASNSVLQKVADKAAHKESLKKKSVHEFSELKKKLDGQTITIYAKVNSGKHLFGAIHEEDIRKRIFDLTGVLVNPKNIKIGTQIKEIGEYTVALVEGTMHTDIHIKIEEKK